MAPSLKLGDEPIPSRRALCRPIDQTKRDHLLSKVIPLGTEGSMVSSLDVLSTREDEWDRGIAAYCDHPVRFGVVESLNTTIKGVLRRARAMRDEAMLLLKLKWATARPIRSSRDLAHCLKPQTLHSNR